MKKVLLVLLALVVFSPLLSAQKRDDETVLIVYQSKIYNYTHDQVQATNYLEYLIKDWLSYHIVEFKPTTREYGKEAVITYHDSEQIQDYGSKYVEKTDSRKEAKAHVVGSMVYAENNSNKKGWGTATEGLGKLSYGVVGNTSRGRNIGWTEKVAVPTRIRGRFVIVNKKAGKNAGEVWSNRIFFLKYNAADTKYVNKNSMTLEQAFDYISQRLADEGYGSKLKYDKDK